jgi:hypothetical protein
VFTIGGVGDEISNVVVGFEFIFVLSTVDEPIDTVVDGVRNETVRKLGNMKSVVVVVDVVGFISSCIK